MRPINNVPPVGQQRQFKLPAKMPGGKSRKFTVDPGPRVFPGGEDHIPMQKHPHPGNISLPVSESQLPLPSVEQINIPKEELNDLLSKAYAYQTRKAQPPNSLPGTPSSLYINSASAELHIDKNWDIPSNVILSSPPNKHSVSTNIPPGTSNKPRVSSNIPPNVPPLPPIPPVVAKTPRKPRKPRKPKSPSIPKPPKMPKDSSMGEPRTDRNTLLERELEVGLQSEGVPQIVDQHVSLGEGQFEFSKGELGEVISQLKEISRKLSKKPRKMKPSYKRVTNGSSIWWS